MQTDFISDVEALSRGRYMIGSNCIHFTGVSSERMLRVQVYKSYKVAV